MATLVQDFISIDHLYESTAKIEIVYHKGVAWTGTKRTETKAGNAAVILLPHWGGTSRTYRTLQDHIAQLNPEITTVAISYPGTGNSSRNPVLSDRIDRGQDAQIGTLTMVVKALIPQLATTGPCIELRKGVILVGHSMGAKVATDVLVSDSKQNLRIKALLLLGPAPPGPLEISPAERATRKKAYDSARNARYAITEVLGLVTASDKIVEDCIQDAIAMDDQAKKGWIERGIDEDLRPKLIAASDETKNTKVHIVAGDEDFVEPVGRVQLLVLNIFKILGGFKDVEMKTLPFCGHMMTIDNAKEVAMEVGRLVSHGSSFDVQEPMALPIRQNIDPMLR